MFLIDSPSMVNSRASTGHPTLHIPHRTHLFSSTHIFASSASVLTIAPTSPSSIASTGHTFSQIPQPIQTSSLKASLRSSSADLVTSKSKSLTSFVLETIFYLHISLSNMELIPLKELILNQDTHSTDMIMEMFYTDFLIIQKLCFN